MLSNQNSNIKSVSLKNLSLQEKIALVEDLWDEISNSQNSLYISEEQKKELDIRLSKYQINIGDSKNWSIVREKIKSRL